MAKPIIGVDLDGVIAEEDIPLYKNLKLVGGDLETYYKYRPVNHAFIQVLKNYAHLFDFVIVTARKRDCSNLEDITHEWLEYNNVGQYFKGIVFTRWRWKWPELILIGAKAHIDNDYNNIRFLPFIKRIGYNLFFRTPSRWDTVYDLCASGLDFDPRYYCNVEELLFETLHVWFS